VDDRDQNGWTVTPVGRSGRVKVTLDVGPRPLVAELTDEELMKVRSILADALEAAERNEHSRIKLRDALRAAIGRDPFSTADREGERDNQGLFPPWLGLIFILFGAGFAIRNTNVWLQIAGVVFAMITLVDVSRQGVRHMKRRA
jgi:hypothetical protein